MSTSAVARGVVEGSEIHWMEWVCAALSILSFIWSIVTFCVGKDRIMECLRVCYRRLCESPMVNSHRRNKRQDRQVQQEHNVSRVDGEEQLEMEVITVAETHTVTAEEVEATQSPV